MPSDATDHGGPPASRRGLVRLPLSMADFGKRGFRLDHPDSRETLEGHAKFFLTGFNVAARHWRDPHPALAAIPSEERGFAYEGAGMYAAGREILSFGRSRALSILLDGPGDGYVHLVHVGYGWASALMRLPVKIPGTPLLRWLGLDGAGFADAYFGGLRAIRRRSAGRPTDQWVARIAGCGRALWFVESADVVGITAAIASVHEQARPHLWAGIGLAACYAGCADETALDELAEASGRYAPHFGQGALFAIAARFRARIVPKHTELAARRLFAVDAGEAAMWTDEAAEGLTGSPDIAAYLQWRSRLREKAATRL